MKRARWDPVYPFTEERLIPLPPFIQAGSGLESEGLILSLKFTDPITLNPGGFLTLRTGEGIKVNQAGELTSSTALNVEAPLEKLTDNIKLNFDSAFNLEENRLTIALNKPLEKTPNGIKLKLSNYFSIDSQGNLIISSPEFPLFFTQEGKLSIKLGQPFTITDELLTLKTEKPLAVTAGSLKIKLSDPFDELNGNLELKLKQSLTLEDGKLAVKTAGPIQNTEQGINLNVAYPFSTSQNQLSLKVTSPLMINAAGELTTSSRQGSQIVSFFDFIIAIGWQIIPGNVRYIHILTCSQFLPSLSVSNIYFQADAGLAGLFVVDEPFYTTATQQMADKTIKTYGVKITKNAQNTISIDFSSALEPNILVSAWTASISRL